MDTISFLEKLSLKDGADKDQFFRRLNATLDQLPRALVERKVMPLIASGLEFGFAPGAALSSLLHAARGLTPAQLSSRVVPCVIRLYASTDRATRVALLQHLDAYVEHVSNAQMETMYEHMAGGFNDGTAYLRELTLKSLLQVVPKLSQRTLTSNLLKHLAKLQVDEEPAIRANTTICLGNISRFLGAAACKRVLLNAFTRALRDPFPPARCAGLLALQATLEHYDASEGALRVLPAIAPLTVDQDKSVRDAAFDAMDAFVDLLRKHHAARAGDPPGADGAAAATRPLVSPGDASAAAGGASSSLLGWAVGSMGALAAAVGAPPSMTPEKAMPSPARRSAGSPAVAAAAPYARSVDGRTDQPAVKKAAASPPSASLKDADGDGWGGMNDEEFCTDAVRRLQRFARSPAFCLVPGMTLALLIPLSLQEEAAARARLAGKLTTSSVATAASSRARDSVPRVASADKWDGDDDADAPMEVRLRLHRWPTVAQGGLLTHAPRADVQAFAAPPRHVAPPARPRPSAQKADASQSATAKLSAGGGRAAPARPVAAPLGGVKPMKLGGTKLGASKLKGADLDLEALLAD